MNGTYTSPAALPICSLTIACKVAYDDSIDKLHLLGTNRWLLADKT